MNVNVGDTVNVRSRNPRLRGGKVLGNVWVHMGPDGEDICRLLLIKFPRVESPVAIHGQLLEVVGIE